MLMMTSQILNFADVTKAQNSRYLEYETLFFLKIKKIINYTSRLLYAKNSFLAEVTFNYLNYIEKQILELAVNGNSPNCLVAKIWRISR